MARLNIRHFKINFECEKSFGNLAFWELEIKKTVIYTQILIFLACVMKTRHGIAIVLKQLSLI